MSFGSVCAYVSSFVHGCLGFCVVHRCNLLSFFQEHPSEKAVFASVKRLAGNGLLCDL